LTEQAESRFSSPDPDDRRVAVEVACRASNPDLSSLVIEALRDPDARVRRAAVVGVSGSIDAVPALTGALRDPDRDVRFSAVQALARFEHDHALDALITATYDPDDFVREEAIDALARNNSAGLARRLATQLTATNRAGIGEALLRMGAVGEEAIVSTIAEQADEQALAAADLLAGRRIAPDGLDSVDGYARLRAIVTLARVGGPDQVDGLIGALSDPWGPIRSRAMRYLNQLNDVRGLEAVRRALETEQDPDVIEAARKTLLDFA
jgi:HEAT repeat protein